MTNKRGFQQNNNSQHNRTRPTLQLKRSGSEPFFSHMPGKGTKNKKKKPRNKELGSSTPTSRQKRDEVVSMIGGGGRKINFCHRTADLGELAGIRENEKRKGQAGSYKEGKL